MASTRSAAFMIRGSWVREDEGGAALPVEAAISSTISWPVRLSRFAVGSSASRRRGLADQGAGDGDALLLAAGQLGRAMARALGEADRPSARLTRAATSPPRR